ncbi:unnamed protein product [Prorocentrum cordatum]|uniref:Uncharacterized protein n=1 Tax=Prorocentrum cordatum TaxID=2364126 RepID=A0ABN9SCC3_9DINO|nr:unnamed protein product [Polarella glacialis]
MDQSEARTMAALGDRKRRAVVNEMALGYGLGDTLIERKGKVRLDLEEAREIAAQAVRLKLAPRTPPRRTRVSEAVWMDSEIAKEARKAAKQSFVGQVSSRRRAVGAGDSEQVAGAEPQIKANPSEAGRRRRRARQRRRAQPGGIERGPAVHPAGDYLLREARARKNCWSAE